MSNGKRETIMILVNNMCNPSGTERAVINLANILVEDYNYKINILSCFTSEGEIFYEVGEGITIEHLGLGVCAPGSIKWYRRLINKLRARFKQSAPDVLMTTSHGVSIFLPVIASGFPIKTIACEHMGYGAAPLPARMIRRVVYRFVDQVVVLTKTDRKYFSFLKNVSVIPNSLSFIPGKFADMSRKQILAVGRLTYQKGFDRLIECSKILKSRFPDWKVRIVGQGELEQELKGLAQQHEVADYVEFAPITQQIEQEFTSSSIYVLSSRFEGLPMVLLEAKVCGLPTVSFNCPEGPAEVINDGEDGFLVEDGNVEQLAEGLMKLMNDEALRARFSDAARVNAVRFSPKQISTLWKGVLKPASGNI